MGVHRRIFTDIEFATDTVVPGVGSLVDIPLIEKFLENPLHPADMKLVGGPDEVVVLHSHLRPQPFEAFYDFVDQELGSDSPLLRRLLDLLSVFIGPGQVEDLPSHDPMETGKGVADDGGVSVPQMGDIVDIVYWRCHKEFFHSILSCTLG